MQTSTTMNMPRLVCQLARVIQGIFLSALLSSGVRAAEVPEWLSGTKGLLPTVPDATIEEMRSLHAEIHEVPEIGPIPESYYVAAMRIMELRDQASLAMIHLYVEGVPRLRWNDPPATRRPAELLVGVLLGDTISTQWMMPLLRHRLNWIESSVRAGRLDESGVFPDELGAIEGFMNIRGSQKDLMRVHDLMREIAQSKTQFARNMLWVPTESEDEKKANEHRRTRQQRHLQPFYMSFLPVLEEHEKELKRKGIVSEMTARLDSLRSGNSLIGIPITTLPREEPTSAWSWSIIVAMVVAMVGLLWLLVKRRK